MSKHQVPAYKLVGKVCRWQTPHPKRSGFGLTSILLNELKQGAEAKIISKDTSGTFLVVDVCEYSEPPLPCHRFCKILFQDGSCWWTPYKMSWSDAVPNIILA